MAAVKTRFAPSPTGFLHVGGARTALYSWLYARQREGTFLLRIEDTDQVRSTAASAAGILQDLIWLGLPWDQGPVVGGAKNEFFQSERLPIYHGYLQQLIDTGLAYEAHESKADIDAMRKAAEAEKRPFRYRRDMVGRVTTPKSPSDTVLRFAMPHEDITVNDLILGPVTVGASEHDDIVIRKSDGFPTFHFAVVVDDHEMGVTHVLRAQEHLMNTFKHVALYAALGWTPPEHGHLPLVFNMDNTKMSKREKAKVTRAAIQTRVAQQGGATDFSDLAGSTGLPSEIIAAFMAKKTDAVDLAVTLGAAVGAVLPEIDVQDFRRSGYMPEALVNFIALVGWSPGQDREILDRAQMIELFSLDGIQKTPGRFDRKKLLWMNGEYIRKASIDRLLEVFGSFAEVTDYAAAKTDETQRRALLAMYQERMATFAEMCQNAAFFFVEPTWDGKAVTKHINGGGGVEFLRQALAILEPVAHWDLAGLNGPMETVLALGEKKGAAAQAIRVAVSGGTVSPPLLETIAFLGREKTLERLRKFFMG
jgi:glutamyl/glutaminyl-tRNA synthetase